MQVTKITRSRIAAVVVLCLLFAQMATAAYACPQSKLSLSVERSLSTAVAANCDEMAAGQMDEAQPSLCKAHCQAGQQAHESKSFTDVQVQAFDVLWLLAWVVYPAMESSSWVLAETSKPARPPGSPSLYLVNQVFRL